MLRDIACPIPPMRKASEYIIDRYETDRRMWFTPTLQRAIDLSRAWQEEGKGYVDPNFLLDVWTKCYYA